jgi:hypothetical protein
VPFAMRANNWYAGTQTYYKLKKMTKVGKDNFKN